jgi:DNA segregation ATPase FtsK/SpoIIIE-like protein
LKKKENTNDNVKKNKKESDIVTKESFSAVCALFSALAFFILCTRSLIFGDVGVAIHSFFTGLFGYAAYPVLFAVFYISATSLFGKKLVKNRKIFGCIVTALVCVAFVLHTALTYSWSKDGYLSSCFYAGENFPKCTVTGWVGGLFVYLLSTITSKVGAIVIFSLLALAFAYFAYKRFKRPVKAKETSDDMPNEEEWIAKSETEVKADKPVQQSQPAEVSSQAAYTNAYNDLVYGQTPGVRLSDDNIRPAYETGRQSGGISPFGKPSDMRQPQTSKDEYENSREFLFGGTPAENYRRNLIFDPNSQANRRSPANATAQTTTSAYTKSYSEAYQDSVNADVRPAKVFTDYADRTYGTYKPQEEPIVRQPSVSIPTFREETPTSPVVEEPNDDIFTPQKSKESQTEYRRHDYMDLFSPSNPNVFGDDEQNREFAEETFGDRRSFEADFSSRRVEEETPPAREELDFSARRYEEEPLSSRDGINIFDEEEPAEDLRSTFEEPRGTDFTASRGLDLDERMEIMESVEETSRVVEQAIKPQEKPAPPPPPKPRVIRPYVRVPLDDFDCRDIEPTSNLAEVEQTKANIIAILDDFKVTGASIASVTFGPTVTRYNVTIPRNVSPKKVVALDQEIALSLYSSGVNIYPNYEDGVVSIEVPNKERQFVQLGCMLTGDSFVNAKSSSLMFAMGKDVGNRKVYGDISKMIHLLVAGSSGAGKSVFLGSLIVSMIYKYSPEELRLILIDPKKTEFVLYNNLPHLMINEIITDVNKAVQSLNWAIGEMNRRYSLFEQMSRAGTYVVNLDQYNAHIEKNERLPKIVIIIDELADLMLAAKKDIEDRIQNLTQKARAAGIHLIVATQRPSIDVITGVIKSNLPTRIAFAVATDVDSRVILDQSGAQKLLGKGDFLYTMSGINTPVRVQSAFISPEDSQRVVNFIKANNEAYYDESATAFINNSRGGGGDDSFGGGNEEVEPVYIDALRYVIAIGSASISMIQRKCSVGYNKAGKIVEWMEDMGYISSFEGAKARKVLITKEEFESKYGSL